MTARTENIRLRVDVQVSETLDALFLRTPQSKDGGTVLGVIKRHLPECASNVSRSAQGVRIPMKDIAVLAASEPELELAWSSDARRFLENRHRTQTCIPEVHAELQRIKEHGVTRARKKIQDSADLDRLDDHQILNVAAMTIPNSPGLCLFDEQGAGKTVSFIYAFDVLAERNEADQALIVAPKSMVGEWPKDISRFRGDLYKVELLIGSTREKRDVLAAGADIFITNFETAVSMENELKAALRARPGRTVLAIDESFFIKSLDAQRTRALRRLREWAGRAYVLCGTPAPNAPHDLVQQFNLVDFGLSFDDVSIPKERDEAAPVIQCVIDDRGLFVRHLKADVLPDLPAKRFQRLLVPMEPQQMALYKAHLDSLTNEVEEIDDNTFAKNIANFLARRSALLQICSNPASVSDSYKATPAKQTVLDSLVEALVKDQGEKLVIWSFYTASITAMVNRFASYGALRYDGQVTDVTVRQETVRRFQTDDESMILIANPAAAGAGLTLHRARVAIYESLSNQAAHYLQSLDRIHRRGQEREVEYVVILCDGTIEIAEYDRLIQKERAAQALLGDCVDEPLTRESFLDDLRNAAALMQVTG